MLSTRSNKRRVSKLFHGRFHGKVLWRSAEEQQWLDMVPVGREFGSPDYERLNILDMYSWGNITEEDAMRQLGVDRSGLAQMLEGMFGKTAKTVSIDDMNPFKHQP